MNNQTDTQDTFTVYTAGPDDVDHFDDELSALRYANAINRTYVADRLKHPEDDVLCVATVANGRAGTSPSLSDEDIAKSIGLSFGGREHDFKRFAEAVRRTLRAGRSEEGRMPNSKRDYIEGMSVSVDVSTCDDDAENRYFGTVTEVMDAPDDKHGVTLLVQNAKPNFTRPGTLPKDHLVFALIGEFSDACQLPKPYAAVEARIKLEQEIRRLAGRAGQSEPVAPVLWSGEAALRKAAQALVDEISKKLDTDTWPHKYGVPYGKVNDLVVALGVGGAGQSPTVPTDAEAIDAIAAAGHKHGVKIQALIELVAADDAHQAWCLLQRLKPRPLFDPMATCSSDQPPMYKDSPEREAIIERLRRAWESARAALRSTLPQTTGGKGS